MWAWSQEYLCTPVGTITLICEYTGGHDCACLHTYTSGRVCAWMYAHTRVLMIALICTYMCGNDCAYEHMHVWAYVTLICAYTCAGIIALMLICTCRNDCPWSTHVCTYQCDHAHVYAPWARIHAHTREPLSRSFIIHVWAWSRWCVCTHVACLHACIHTCGYGHAKVSYKWGLIHVECTYTCQHHRTYVYIQVCA
jgi:hypothetical protein